MRRINKFQFSGQFPSFGGGWSPALGGSLLGDVPGLKFQMPERPQLSSVSDIKAAEEPPVTQQPTFTYDDAKKYMNKEQRAAHDAAGKDAQTEYTQKDIDELKAAKKQRRQANVEKAMSGIGEAGASVGNAVGGDKGAAIGNAIGALGNLGASIAGKGGGGNPIGGAISGVADAAVGLMPKVTNSGTGAAIMGATDAVANIASKFGPWGAAAGAALKLGMNAINSFGAHKMSNLAVDTDVAEKVGGSYGSSLANIKEMASHSGEKVGGFSFGMANEWEFKMDKGRRDQGIMSQIAHAAEIAKAGGDFEGTAIRNKQILDGGIKTLRAARKGLKLELDWAKRIHKMQQGSVLPEVVVTAPRKPVDNNAQLLDAYEQLKEEWPVLKKLDIELQADDKFEVNWGKDDRGDDILSHIEYITSTEPNGTITYDKSVDPTYSITANHPGKGTLYYNPNKVSIEDIKLDSLHALRELDPDYQKLLANLEQAIDWDNDYVKEELEWNGNKDNTLDGFLRNMLINDNATDFIKSRRYDLPANARRNVLNTDEAKDAFAKLVEYLKTGKVTTGVNTEYQQQLVGQYKNGGPVNVIPEGALHKNKHHMEDDEHITKKGIPVVSNEDGQVKQQAEIEQNEIILHLELTQKLEQLAKEGTEEAAIEAGKLLVQEILHNTDDRTGLLNEVE